MGGFVIMLIYRAVPFVERHFERSVMVYSYLAIALIIFWGVIDRFVFNDQEPWSTTIPSAAVYGDGLVRSLLQRPACARI